MFSSIPPVVRNDEGLGRMCQQISTWLQAWCHRQGFELSDNGLVYKRPGLFTTDGNSLSHRSTRVLRRELAGLIVKSFKLGMKVGRGETGVTRKETECYVPAPVGDVRRE